MFVDLPLLQYSEKIATNTIDTNNYRGISLLNICSKLYTYILNKRLSNFVEEKPLIGDEQAGVKSEHSTMDHVLTLLSVIQKQINNKTPSRSNVLPDFAARCIFVV